MIGQGFEHFTHRQFTHAVERKTILQENEDEQNEDKVYLFIQICILRIILGFFFTNHSLIFQIT